MIDPRFLTPHPRTVEWWRQRETCRACSHLRGRTATARSSVTWMHCAAARSACIDARDLDGPCGPGAALFT